MGLQIIKCPHCSATVVPMANGNCPACRQRILEDGGAPDSVKTASEQPQAVAAHVLPADSENHPATMALAPLSIKFRIASWRQLEEPFEAVHKEALDTTAANPGSRIAIAERIENKLIPELNAAHKDFPPPPVSDLTQRSILTDLNDFARLRVASWQVLAEGLRESDSLKLQQHAELHDDSEKLLVAVLGALGKERSWKAVTAQHFFKQTLTSLTPRVFVTPTLVGLNVLVYVVMVVSGVHFFAPATQDLLAWGGNFGAKTMHGEWWRLVTCTFLHAGFFHLLFNLWVLWGVGSLVERLVGNVGFLLLYSVAGIAGSIASLAWNPMVVSVGASGAIYGIIGALLSLVFMRRDTIPLPVLEQYRNSAGLFLLYNIYYSLRVPGIDVAAHIGGLVAGIFGGLILSQPLTLEFVRRRALRNCGLTAVAMIALPSAALMLPEPPPDLEKVIEKLIEHERHVIATYNDLVRKQERAEINEEDFADSIQHNVLVPWQRARRQFSEAINTPHVKPPVVSRLDEYMALREEGWSMQVEAIRTQDTAKFQQAAEKNKAADELAKGMMTQ